MQNFMFLLLLHQQKTIQNQQKQLSEGFKKPVYWNKYKVIHNKTVEITDASAEIA